MIVNFVIDKMSSYIVGGMCVENAAKFTLGELEAIYKGNHHSRDISGAWRITPPPEALPVISAMRKADTAIAEILKYCHETARKGLSLNRKTEMANTHTAPEIEPRRTREAALNGFDKMADYAKRSA
jgi:hypothetical protein